MLPHPIKVVHISTYINGGAGSAAYRLHQALLSNKVDSYFLCLEPVPQQAKATAQLKAEPKTLFVKGIEKITRLLPGNLVSLLSSRQKDIRNFEAIYPSLECSFASLPFSDIDVLDNPLVKEADLIHLHWIAGMVDYPVFFKKNKKPVVWTLHDMNPFKGLYHYEEDEKRNEHLTAVFNERIQIKKENAIGGRNCSLTFVTPSLWLKQEAEISESFKTVQGFTIPNPVNTGEFKPRDTTQLKMEMNIAKENTVFLFVAEAIGDYRKGFDLLIHALNDLKGYPLSLLAIGNNPNMANNTGDITFLGSTADVEKLSAYYSLADAVIVPSREDNLPNVMTEAMACGTPVLSFNTGGMSTTIRDYFNGLKAAAISPDALKDLLLEFIKTKDRFNTDAIQKFAVDNFSANIVAKKYKEVYAGLPVQDL